MKIMNMYICPDMLIIPGSKDTIKDMKILSKLKIVRYILKYEENGGLIIGICGGYQILGNKIIDENEMDNLIDDVEGLGILNMETIFSQDKKTSQIKQFFGNETGYFKNLLGIEINGYELHFGRKHNKNVFKSTNQKIIQYMRLKMVMY